MNSLLPSENVMRDREAQKRLFLIAEEAMVIPDEDKTTWDYFRCAAPDIAQKRGPHAEKVIIHALNAKKVSAKDGKGDMLYCGAHYEIKCGFSKAINMRQIRLWQNVDYLVAYINVEDKSDCRCYVLSHDEMEEEVSLIGSVSHGTKEAVADNKNIEYSITLSKSERSPAFVRWEEKYRSTAMEKVLFSLDDPGLDDLGLGDPRYAA